MWGVTVRQAGTSRNHGGPFKAPIEAVRTVTALWYREVLKGPPFCRGVSLLCSRCNCFMLIKHSLFLFKKKIQFCECIDVYKKANCFMSGFKIITTWSEHSPVNECCFTLLMFNIYIYQLFGKFGVRKFVLENLVSENLFRKIWCQKICIGKFGVRKFVWENLFLKIRCWKICCRKNSRIPFS